MVKVLTDLFPAHYNGYKNITPGMYLNEMLKRNLDIMKAELKRDWDFFLVIDGPEGSGKSVFAMQVMAYMDPNFKIDNITFSAKEFTEAVKNAKRYSCVVYDEAYGGLSSRRSMTMTNHVLVKMFTEIRQRNLSIILVLPSFFDLDKMPAIHRTRALLHVTAKNFRRGFFNFYSYKRKRTMYLLGKKAYQYSVVKPNFSGQFTKFYPIDESEYKKRKIESLKIQATLQEEEEKSTFRACEFAYHRLTEMLGWQKVDHTRLARQCGFSDYALYKRCFEIRKALMAKYGDADKKKLEKNSKANQGIQSAAIPASVIEKNRLQPHGELSSIKDQEEEKNDAAAPLGGDDYFDFDKELERQIAEFKAEAEECEKQKEVMKNKVENNT